MSNVQIHHHTMPFPDIQKNKDEQTGPVTIRLRKINSNCYGILPQTSFKRAVVFAKLSLTKKETSPDGIAAGLTSLMWTLSVACFRSGWLG